MIQASKIDIGALINAGIGLITKKTTGPVAVAEKANDYTPVQSSTPAWLVPVAVVAVVLLFGKKLFK